MSTPARTTHPRTPPVAPGEVFEVLRRHLLVDGFHLVLDLERSHGSRVHDAATGRWYLDFYTFFASSPVGINHPKLLDEEFRARLLRAAVNKPANSDAYTVEMAQFVRTLERVAMPDTLPYLFLVEGGAVAVENAVKTAFDWKIRKNLARGAKEERGRRILHFREAFHGRTGYALSLTNTDPVKTDLFPKFDWPRIDNPKIPFSPEGDDPRQIEAAEARAIGQIEDALRAHPDDIAALILEPIQGEGGDNHFRAEFFQQLRRLCDAHEILFVLDEIQSGVGMTGRMWAYQHFGVEPDILCFGKKLQVCGIMVSRRIDDVPDHVFRLSGRINSTWGGNLADMVRGARYLEIIEEEGLVDNAARMGDVLLDGLRRLQARHPEHVFRARGRGLMCAFDLGTPALRRRVMERCWANGLLMLASGPQGIRFRPALNVTREDIEEGVERLDRSIAEAIG